MAYTYVPGDGLAVLDPTEPDGSTEAIEILDDAIRQIKAYLVDTTAGPEALLAARVPPGSVQMYVGSSSPSGWLICDGTAVSRTTYADLFGIIGTAYGAGDGSTTFNLPDFRGRAPIGVGTGSGLTARTRGDQVGTEALTTTAVTATGAVDAVTSTSNMQPSLAVHFIIRI